MRYLTTPSGKELSAILSQMPGNCRQTVAAYAWATAPRFEQLDNRKTLAHESKQSDYRTCADDLFRDINVLGQYHDELRSSVKAQRQRSGEPPRSKGERSSAFYCSQWRWGEASPRQVVNDHNDLVRTLLHGIPVRKHTAHGESSKTRRPRPNAIPLFASESGELAAAGSSAHRRNVTYACATAGRAAR